MSNLGITSTHYKMKNIAQNLLHIFLVVLLVACSSDSKQLTLLDGAESVMTSAPDSALSLLREIKSNKLNRADNARYALLLSQALDKNYIDVTDDSLINIAVEYYKHKNDEYLFTAYYYKGRVLENARNLHGAMHLYTCAEQLIENIDDNYAKGLLYARIGGLYKEFYDFDKSLEYYNKALKSFKDAQSDKYQFYTQFYIAQVYKNKKEYDIAENLFLDILDWSYQNKYWGLCEDCLMFLCNIYEQNNDTDKLSSLHQSSLFTQFSNSLWGIESQAYLKSLQKDEKQVQSLLNRAWAISSTQKDTINLYHLEYRLYSKMGNTYLALNNFEKVVTLQDSIVRVTLEHPLLTVQCDYYQSQAELQALQLKFNQMCIVVFAIILIMALVCIVLYIRNIFKNLALKDAEIEQYINDVEELRCTINRKEDTIDNMTTQINDLFLQQFQFIDDLTKTYYETSMSKNINNIIYNRVKNEIKAWSENKDYIDKLEMIINKYRNNVMSVARCNLHLPDRDFLLLIYIYAGLSAKAISIFTGNSVDNVYTKKKRIKKYIRSLDENIAQILLKYF